ncbi:hypothetical protein YC2023_002895 [Brassica napus]
MLPCRPSGIPLSPISPFSLFLIPLLSLLTPCHLLSFLTPFCHFPLSSLQVALLSLLIPCHPSLSLLIPCRPLSLHIAHEALIMFSFESHQRYQNRSSEN